jgi:hypothetical protein
MDVGYNAFSGKSCSLSAGRLVSADAIDLGKFPQRRDRPRECAISAGDCSAGYSHETNVAAVKAFVPRASSREQWTHHVPVLPPAFDRSTIGSRLFGKVPVCSDQVLRAPNRYRFAVNRYRFAADGCGMGQNRCQFAPNEYSFAAKSYHFASSRHGCAANRC